MALSALAQDAPFVMPKPGMDLLQGVPAKANDLKNIDYARLDNSEESERSFNDVLMEKHNGARKTEFEKSDEVRPAKKSGVKKSSESREKKATDEDDASEATAVASAGVNERNDSAPTKSAHSAAVAIVTDQGAAAEQAMTDESSESLELSAKASEESLSLDDLFSKDFLESAGLSSGLPALASDADDAIQAPSLKQMVDGLWVQSQMQTGVQDASFSLVGNQKMTLTATAETPTMTRTHLVDDMKPLISHVLATEDGGEMTMSLRPAHLGAVKVEIRVDAGAVKVAIQAEQPEAKAVLQKQIGELKQQLTVSGLRVEDVSVSTMQTSSSDQSRDSRNESRQQQSEYRQSQDESRRNQESDRNFDEAYQERYSNEQDQGGVA